MQTIHNAQAKRAGAAITITGKTAEGAPLKVAGVALIEFKVECGAHTGHTVQLWPIATTKDGRQYRVAP